MSKDSSEMFAEFENTQAAIEMRLGEYFTEETKYSILLEAMRYSLVPGGKHIRAVICVKFCEAAGGKRESALDAACAIEMLHTYSLIHDDLPCMDDDDMRRGRPANHIKFGEYTATLAGDALQAAAFDTLLRSRLSPDKIADMARVLADAAGPHGICGGQYLDLLGEGKQHTLEELLEINALKTSALISASARIGVIAAGGSQEQIKAAEEYAQAVGLAFQARDDMLDCTASAEELGKPIGSDKEKNKATFASLLSFDECERRIKEETERATEALDGKFADSGFLIWLARMLAERRY